MEMKNFGYSLRNMPIPMKRKYLKCMVEKVEVLSEDKDGKYITFVMVIHKLKMKMYPSKILVLKD